jgi:hypothetical protein
VPELFETTLALVIATLTWIADMLVWTRLMTPLSHM